MIKKLALIIGFIICLSSCGKDYVYRIEGELSNLEDQTVYAVFEKDNYKVVDTVACTKPGQFQIDQNEAGFHCVTIFFADKEHWVTAYLEPGETVKITGDANSPLLLQVKGGRTNDKLTAFKKKIAPLLTELTNLSNSLNSKDLNDTIEETEEEFRIGCMVTLRDLELDPGLNSYTDGAARESVRHIVGVQFRNLATVGGSIYGRYGFSDVLTMFLTMDSYVELYKGGIIPLKEYAKMPYDRDILVRLIVKKEKAAFDYQSVRNSQTDFPVLTCAAAKTEAGYRFSIGARPGKAVLFELADADIQAADVENMAENAAKCVKEQVETGSNTRGSAEYRKHLAGVLVRRAVCKLAGK